MTPADAPQDIAPQDAALSRRPGLIRRFWSDFLRPRAGLMGVALLLSAVEGSTLGALSWMLEPLFDSVFASGGSHALAWVGAAILALFRVSAGLMALAFLVTLTVPGLKLRGRQLPTPPADDA